MDTTEKAPLGVGAPGEATGQDNLPTHYNTERCGSSNRQEDTPKAIGSQPALETPAVAEHAAPVPRAFTAAFDPPDSDAPSSTGLDDVLEVVRTHFGSTPSIVDATEASIAAVCSLLLADTESCVALILEGPASSGKTTALNFLMGKPLRRAKIVEVSDSFTPASFVSHAANRTKEQLEENDLLPRIRHKAFIVPDLAPTLSAREEDLTSKLGILTRILDGQGYASDSGTHGHREYTGDYRFTMLAATTPLSPTAWGVLGRLGNRVVLLETGAETTSTGDLVATMLSGTTYMQRVNDCTGVVSGFLSQLWKDSGGYGKLAWGSTADDPTLLDVIAKVALFVVRARGTVRLDEWGDFSGLLQIEAPHRLMSALSNLARGHAIAFGRRNLAREDVQLAVRVGLDSMPMERRRVVRALLRAEDGKLMAADVERALGRSRPTALNVMGTLVALGAVAHSTEGQASAIGLLESESWLVDESYRWAFARVP